MSSLNLVAGKTAVVLIDLQNGITGYPLVPHSSADVIARANRLTSELRAKGATVVYVRVSMTEILTMTVDAPVRDRNAPPPQAIASELVQELDRQPGDLVITKRQWGAFYGTELDQQLRRRDIQTIVIGGVATNFGVESTARDAFDRGYELVFVEDAMTTLSAEAHKFATEVIFPRMGRVRTTDVVLEASRA
ncbi:isochorismatase family protein [Acidicapsa acidisoli]|uniref:isochorismatase family protein n=1 Tax=Acidicapsa acidisoli TaxID=1615681 RepID=UPI0021E022DF|nr:isochorismatase family protein [Acidicapsa acidisoli]